MCPKSENTESPNDGLAQPDLPPMPLALAVVGQELEFVSVRAGHKLQYRLAEMGLTPGTRFRVMTRGRPGPFIILFKDMRLILGHGMASRIYVRPA